MNRNQSPSPARGESPVLESTFRVSTDMDVGDTDDVAVSDDQSDGPGPSGQESSQGTGARRRLALNTPSKNERRKKKQNKKVVSEVSAELTALAKEHEEYMEQEKKFMDEYKQGKREMLRERQRDREMMQSWMDHQRQESRKMTAIMSDMLGILQGEYRGQPSSACQGTSVHRPEPIYHGHNYPGGTVSRGDQSQYGHVPRVVFPDQDEPMQGSSCDAYSLHEL